MTTQRSQSSQPSSQSSDQSASSSQSGSGGGGPSDVRKKAGERLGQWIRRKYCLESLLGVGGMATVYAARHRNGSRVAIKIMHAEFAREEGVKRRFLREGYVANKVDHPGVVRIQDDDETDLGEPFLVMELLEGETLQQLWKRRKRKVPPPEALSIAAQILDCLVPFHEQRIIHRDLKPANIFIVEPLQAKLLDFGVAQLREAGEAMTRAGTALGTPSFMSPEQAQGKSDQLDGRSDVFSVGATLYAVVSGKRLHHGRSDNEAFILAATQPAPSLARTAPDLDVELIALIDRALQWDRRKRFRDAAEMRDACVEVLQKMGAAIPTNLSVAPPPAVDRPSDPTIGASPAARRGELKVTPPPVFHAQSPQSLPPGGTPGHGMRVPSAPPLGTPADGIQSGHYPPAPPPLRRNSVSHAPGTTPGSGVSVSAPVPVGTPAGIKGRPTMPPGTPSAHDQAAVRPPQEEAPERLVDFFERLERSIGTLRQYGFEHPEGQQRMKMLHRIMAEALRDDPERMSFKVHPFCFTHGRATAWEPTPPTDIVPYNLSVAGLEEVVFVPGLEEDEMAAFLEAILLDPGQDEDSDIAAALWEARFKHIKCNLRDDLIEADAAEQLRFFNEADQLEEMAREDLAEAAAMAMSTDRGGFEAAQDASRALELDPGTKAALGTQVSIEPERWQERFLDLALDAFVDAKSRQEEQAFAEPLAQHGWILTKKAHYPELMEVHRVLLERQANHAEAQRWRVDPVLITESLFAERTLDELIRLAGRENMPAERRQELHALLAQALHHLGSGHVLSFLEQANDLDRNTHPALYERLLGYVEQHLHHHHQAVIDRLDSLEPSLAQRMLAAVTAGGGEGAVAFLKPLLMSPNPALKCEATALLATSPDELGKQLVRLLSSSDAALRAASLTTMLRHQVRSAGPGLVRVIESETFPERLPQEQEQMFSVLYHLNAARAESLAIQILEQHGMLVDEKLDQLRTLAAEALGRHADSAAPLDALENAARRRPWNTQQLRSSAAAAVESIRSRLQGGPGGTG